MRALFSFIRKLWKEHPHILSVTLSLLLHFIFLSLQEPAQTREKPKKEKKPKPKVEATLKLQLEEDQIVTTEERVIEENYFEDSPAEEEKLFELKEDRDPVRDVEVDYDRSFRTLGLEEDVRAQADKARSKGKYYPFYSLDSLPQPLTGYASVITFPEAALATGMTNGAVVVELLISAEGRVEKARCLTDSGLGFEEAVTSGIVSVTFSPGKKDDKPVPSLLRERLLFTVR